MFPSMREFFRPNEIRYINSLNGSGCLKQNAQQDMHRWEKNAGNAIKGNSYPSEFPFAKLKRALHPYPLITLSFVTLTLAMNIHDGIFSKIPQFYHACVVS